MTGGGTDNIARRAGIAAVSEFADVPDAGLLLAVVIHKILMQRQRIARHVTTNFHGKASRLFVAVILHHAVRHAVTGEPGKNIQLRLSLSVILNVGFTAAEYHNAAHQ